MRWDALRSWWVAVLVAYPLIIVAVALVMKFTGSAVLTVAVGVALFAIRLKLFRRPSSVIRRRSG